ncbi:cAMP-dependent protein kinase type II regulatory subunit [Cimex lectularius]|uniref:cAMP-dependent protein kinase type II regulatory subunit n=1 Tax=Cimex lectularius TaxID=79782 RepID=A0A8I6RQ87_CIMLE|nr:cAMP-dependent protein kinase type II regulatory subunit [Cimex lectularius]
MNRQAGNKINVPEDFRSILLEFTVNFLLEQPTDVIEFAIQHFNQLKIKRDQSTALKPTSQDESASTDDEDDLPPKKFNSRRKSVFAEAYDPEDDDDDGAAPQIYPKSDEQRQRLAENVRNILLFRSLDQEQMNEVLDAMFEKTVKKDDVVIKQGDDGDNFYVIESGTYQAFVKGEGNQDKLIHTYNNSGSFGELALLYNMPRAATIVAASEGSLWAMDRQTFRRIVLKSAFKKRKMYEALIDCVPMLKTLQPYERMNLADALIPKSYNDGECIIRQYDAADGMYFVEDGKAQISMLGENNKEVPIKTIEKGDYFGELALVTHRPRAASAYAIGHVKVAFLDVEAFERLLGPCMELMKRNIDDYETQIEKIFGAKINMDDVR